MEGGGAWERQREPISKKGIARERASERERPRESATGKERDGAALPVERPPARGACRPECLREREGGRERERERARERNREKERNRERKRGKY